MKEILYITRIYTLNHSCLIILTPFCLNFSFFLSLCPCSCQAGRCKVQGVFWVGIIAPRYVQHAVWVITPDIRHVQVSTIRSAEASLPSNLASVTAPPQTPSHKERKEEEWFCRGGGGDQTKTGKVTIGGEAAGVGLRKLKRRKRWRRCVIRRLLFVLEI